jgi:hypothetical protein
MGGFFLLQQLTLETTSWCSAITSLILLSLPMIDLLRTLPSISRTDPGNPGVCACQSTSLMTASFCEPFNPFQIISRWLFSLSQTFCSL